MNKLAIEYRKRPKKLGGLQYKVHRAAAGLYVCVRVMSDICVRVRRARA